MRLTGKLIFHSCFPHSRPDFKLATLSGLNHVLVSGKDCSNKYNNVRLFYKTPPEVIALLTRIADSLFYVFLTDEIIVNMASLYLRCIFWFIIYFLEINAINRTYKQLWKDMIFPNVFKSSIYLSIFVSEWISKRNLILCGSLKM